MSTIVHDVKDNIAILSISSPPANALSSQILADLEQVLDKIEMATNIKVIILKGEGKFFSAGADIKEFTSLKEADDYEAIARYGQQLFNRIEQFSIPIIAAIHGASLGGGLELAMACHMRIVTEDAKLGSPELTLGILPGFAGTQRLPQYVGSAKAYEMILTGDAINGKEAHMLGLANHAVPKEELMTETYRLAERIAIKSKPATERIMHLLPYAKSENFNRGVEEEAKAFAQIFGTSDAKEGVQAFIEKRKPNFQDR